MFGQKTKGSDDPQNTTIVSDKHTSASQDDFSIISKLPVFTMKTDLENIENPNYTKGKDNESSRELLWEKEILKKENESDSPQTQKKKSPFLDIETTPAKDISAPKEKEIKEEKKETEKDSSGGFFSFFKKKKEQPPKNIPVKEINETKKELESIDLKKISANKIPDENIVKKNEPVFPKKEKTPENEITLVSNASLLKKNSAKKTKSLSNFIPFIKNKEPKIFKEKEKKENELSTSQKELASLNSELQEQKTILDKIKEEEKAYTEKNLRMKDDLASKENELNEKKTTIQKIEAQIVELNNKKKELDLNQEKLSSSKKELDVLNANLQEQKTILDKIKEEEKAYTEKNLHLKNDLISKENELNEKKTTIQKIEAQILEMNNKKKALDDLNMQLETQKKILNIIKNEEAEYSKKNSLLKDELIAKEKELNEKKNNMQKIEAQINELSNKKKELDEKSSTERNIFGMKKQPAIPAANPNPQIIQKPTEKTEKKPEEKSTQSNKTLVFAIALLFILIVITGGYYSWTNRGNNESNVISEIPEITQPKIIENAIPALSLESPNYLSFDLENPTSLNETLKKYLIEIAKTNPDSLVEFILTDKMNNPISFENFARNFGLTLSGDVLAQLNQDFNLYVYNYGENKLRLGISISSKDDIALDFALKESEATLAQQLSPLFLDKYTPTTDNKIFSDGKYKEVKVRYQNIADSEEIALDYAVSNKNLIIGTTKSTAFSILDRKIK